MIIADTIILLKKKKKINKVDIHVQYNAAVICIKNVAPKSNFWTFYPSEVINLGAAFLIQIIAGYFDLLKKMT